METSIKLCVDCRHCFRNDGYEYTCRRLPSIVDPVTGELVPRPLPCRRERNNDVLTREMSVRLSLMAGEHSCGPEGRFWEPRALRTNVIERIWRRLHGHSVSTQ